MIRKNDDDLLSWIYELVTDFEDENDEINPVQTDTTDATFQFDNENAIVVNFKNKKQGE